MADTLEERIVPAQWVHESRPLERVRNINVAGSVRFASDSSFRAGSQEHKS